MNKKTSEFLLLPDEKKGYEQVAKASDLLEDLLDGILATKAREEGLLTVEETKIILDKYR